ncbi:duodenase-1 [Brachyhypopomus gauderio]|uniref:duodenase-1 n=1 Tax=Brachyhypopomus gauderio TaxID=698409 RepID=UPI004041BE08
MNITLRLGTFVFLLLFTQGGFLRHGIIGGRESIPHSHPYMVYLLGISGNICDGFLVTKDFVMTAAHCSQSVIAFLGIHNKNDIKTISKRYLMIAESFPHPKYNNITFENDIMLLKLSEPAELNNRVRTVDLPRSEEETFTPNCLVMGWGCQTVNKTNLSEVLKEVNITALKCTVPDMICSEGVPGPGCGDSGGPLVCGNVAQGIVSNTHKINNANMFRTRYTRISHYLSWIYSIINKKYDLYQGIKTKY